MTEPGKISLTSMAIVEKKREELKRCLEDVFPEVVVEGAINFGQFRRVLGDWVQAGQTI